MTNENLNEAPRRWRRPRFKLSTILLMVAICAWAMACRRESYCEAQFDNYPGNPTWMSYFDGGVSLEGAGLEADMILGTKLMQATVFIDPAMAWPFLALAALLTWKWIADWRKRWREQPAATWPHSNTTPPMEGVACNPPVGQVTIERAMGMDS